MIMIKGNVELHIVHAHKNNSHGHSLETAIIVACIPRNESLAGRYAEIAGTQPYSSGSDCRVAVKSPHDQLCEACESAMGMMRSRNSLRGFIMIQGIIRVWRFEIAKSCIRSFAPHGMHQENALVTQHDTLFRTSTPVSRHTG